MHYQDTREFRELDRMMRQVPNHGRRKPESCESCMYYQPEFKYRTCLYARCPYGIKKDVFRKELLCEISGSEKGRR